MERLTKTEIKSLQEKISDPNLPLEERKIAHQTVLAEALNPVDQVSFDPKTFDPMQGVPDFEVKKRDRVKPPDRLPTLGMLPKQILEGQMIGMYESKQDLYLIMAHYINDLLDRIEALEGNKQ